MSGSTLFTDAMALTKVGDGVYDGELNEHWTIGPKVHGGAMLALCANAARTEHAGDGVEPIAVSGNFLWAPDPGPMRVVTTVRKRGRRVSLIDVELNQGDRTAVRAAVTLGEPEHHVPPLLSVNPVVPLMQPEPPPGLEPIGPGHPMADVVHLARGCDIRPSLTSFTPRTDGGPPIIEYWVRPKGTAPDV
ncbi:thioesterase family protein, partial [Mycolicibacterium elephantis]